MDWNAVGAIGEIVGAAAVIATLAYVSRQIRDQNRALQTTIRDSAFQQLQEWNYQIIADRPLAALFQRGAMQEDWSAMDELDRARLVHVFYSFFKVFESIFLHSCDGSVDADVWKRNCVVFFAYARQPGCRYYWEHRKGTFDPRFQAVVDGDTDSGMIPGSQIASMSLE